MHIVFYHLASNMYLNYMLILFLFLGLPVKSLRAKTQVAKTKSFDNTTSCDQVKRTEIISSCCNIPRDDRLSKSCRKSLMNQKKTTTNNGESRNLKSDKVALHACIAECVFKQNGYMLANGTINRLVMQKSFEQRYRNDPVVAQVMIKSLNNSQRRTQQFEWMHTKDQCDYNPVILLSCTMGEVYKNCPASKWSKSEECTAIKKFMLACESKK